MRESPRSRIVAFLDSVPGASIRHVAAELGLDDSTADYHLRRLHKDGAVRMQRQGRELCWYNAGSGLCPVLRRMIPALRQDVTARVALALTDTPQPSTAISERAQVPLGRARWALVVLEESGLVEKSSRGRVALADGASTCIRNALTPARCDQWGQCPVSRRVGVAAPAVSQRRDGR